MLVKKNFLTFQMTEDELIVLQRLVYSYYGILFLPILFVGLIIIWYLFILHLICGPVAGTLLLLLISVLYTLSIIFRLMVKAFFKGILSRNNRNNDRKV
jgi:hypothetical protein